MMIVACKMVAAVVERRKARGPNGWMDGHDTVQKAFIFNFILSVKKSKDFFSFL